MTIRKQYLSLAIRTLSRKNKQELNVRHAVWGIFTEVAEVIDMIKKGFFYSDDQEFNISSLIEQKEKVALEIGDIFWYAACYLDAYQKNDKDMFNVIMATDLGASIIHDAMEDLSSDQIFEWDQFFEKLTQQACEFLHTAVRHDVSIVDTWDQLLTLLAYCLTLGNALGYSDEQILEMNIKKLEARYTKSAFSKEEAFKRDEAREEKAAAGEAQQQ